MDSNLYSKKSLYNFFHKFRLKKTTQFLDKTLYLLGGKPDSYIDFGCFDGYVTGLIASKYDIAKTVGYDHNMSALEAAKEIYGQRIAFRPIDLNKPMEVEQYSKAKLITCFETLEHVVHLENALHNIVKCLDENGMLIISVPIETGLVGLIKFIVKMVFFKARYHEQFYDNIKISALAYMKCLCKNERIDQHRKLGGDRAFWV